jgi:hypothetical protein
MQVSKFRLTVCAVIVCAGFISVHAQDNPAQAAARAALMEQMNGAQTPPTQPSAAAPPAAPAPAPAAPEVTPASSAKSVSAAPIDMQPATNVPAASNSTPEDTEAQAKARAALLEIMQTPSQAPSAVPAPAAVPAMMLATNAVAAQPPSKPVQPTPEQPVKQAENEPGFAPIVAPPLPISMTKEQQLQVLNARYMANEISPQEYFKQREAIINGP